MTRLRYILDTRKPRKIGLIVLQADETIELDFRRLFPHEIELFVSRIPSGADLTQDSIGEMAHNLSDAARLLPQPASMRGVYFGLDAIGYACTSATAQIGTANVARLILDGALTQYVSEPVSALIAACRRLDIRRLGILSPYVAPISARLRAVLRAQDIETPAFASFEESSEARVVRISAQSVYDGALAVAAQAPADAPLEGLFLSCTNLRTLDVIPALEDHLGIPVFSSNQVLAWDLLWHTQRMSEPATFVIPGRLGHTSPTRP
ncbi:maleate cis-trans isomerase family protein [Pseudooceanicola sediminis]|uniref:maleate cis-trans isomerase family protein n=1 Tax=Pseudooceanicola sediminis TaxID=2211117 RepID=UPI00131475CA|nr:aspartate/glutamate racemase family protein [Pseudooceanicola sediminis]|tara:strand:+ start:15116 stop:15910 length:795 start_codon:yes stop_codon:yes gene_type:complete